MLNYHKKELNGFIFVGHTLEENFVFTGHDIEDYMFWLHKDLLARAKVLQDK